MQSMTCLFYFSWNITSSMTCCCLLLFQLRETSAWSASAPCHRMPPVWRGPGPTRSKSSTATATVTTVTRPARPSPPASCCSSCPWPCSPPSDYNLPATTHLPPTYYPHTQPAFLSQRQLWPIPICIPDLMYVCMRGTLSATLIGAEAVQSMIESCLWTSHHGSYIFSV